MYLLFASKADCDYFVSIKADHWWWLSSAMYHGRRIGDVAIEADESFRAVFLNPKNKPEFHKGLLGEIRLADVIPPSS